MVILQKYKLSQFCGPKTKLYTQFKQFKRIINNIITKRRVIALWCSIRRSAMASHDNIPLYIIKVFVFIEPYSALLPLRSALCFNDRYNFIRICNTFQHIILYFISLLQSHLYLCLHVYLLS